MYNYIAIAIGTISFFVGFWFLAKSRGEDECTNNGTDGGKYSKANLGGGIAGVVLGLIVLGIGIFLTVRGL